MKTIDLFIFDLDGTLAQTGEDLVLSVNYTLKTLGLSTLESGRIIGFVGDGIRNLLVRALGDEHEDRADEALAIFSTHYEGHLLDRTILYPEVLPCLEYYRHKRKVVLSNKRQHFVERILESLGVEHYFDLIMGGDAYPYMKPDPRVVYPLLESFGAAPERTVIVGDGRNDVLLARNAGIQSCAILSGLTKREELMDLRPDYVCENLAGLSTLFD
jgi:phosphoglycolate phosphatase